MFVPAATPGTIVDQPNAAFPKARLRPRPASLLVSFT